MGRKTVKSASQIAANWGAAMADPKTAQKYAQGIAGVSGNPMAMAAQNLGKYKTSTAAAVDSGRMASALNAVNPADWKARASAAAATGFPRGAQKGQSKMNAAMAKMQPAYQAASDAAAAIPHDGSMASAMARVQAAIQALKQAAGKPTT